MDEEQYAHERKMRALSYNKLAKCFTEALEERHKRLGLLLAIDKAMMNDEIPHETIVAVLGYLEEEE